MTDPSFNLAQLTVRPNWYDHLPAVEAAMADSDRATWARFDAGWTADEGGWFAPDGTPESDWEESGWPFPEDVQAYTALIEAWQPTWGDPDPYPKAPTHRRPGYRR